ncbi:MAG: nuclear transport factor 2 family protein [Pseudomonadota bacterium]
MPHKRKTLETYFQEVWVKGNLDALDSLFAPGARTRGIMGDTEFDAEELKELVGMVRPLLGPITFAVPKVMEQDDWLSALVEIKSHSVENDTPVHVFNQVMARFDGERMVEIYSNLDGLTFFEQLGLLPDNAMAVMLGGTRLR